MILPFVVLLAACQPPAGKTPPPIVDPGPYTTPAAVPSDAEFLFDGSSLDGWTTLEGKPAEWACEKAPGGSMIVAPGKGNIISTAEFGDAQIHLEFATPLTAGTGQDRGNSGVYIHGRYEVQVLDSYQSQTYPDGQCGAIYGQAIPLVNACRIAGAWQVYDIIFRAAKFDGDTKAADATITVMHNGVLIHDHVKVSGPTGGASGKGEMAKGPLMLQEHGHAVKFRNVWIRKLN
ncbi:MAG: DUF1080 domain-containing protein [Phycisphaerales bacterium]